MFAPSLEGARSVAAKKEQIEQKETKLTKVFGVPESAPESYKNLRFLCYLLLKISRRIKRKETKVTKISFALKLNEAAPRRIRDSFSSADDIHLGEDALYMRLDCAFTNEEG